MLERAEEKQLKAMAWLSGVSSGTARDVCCVFTRRVELEHVCAPSSDVMNKALWDTVSHIPLTSLCLKERKGKGYVSLLFD